GLRAIITVGEECSGMVKTLTYLAIVAATLPLAGCGCTPSAGSMKRYSLRNAPEDAEPPKPPPVAADPVAPGPVAVSPKATVSPSPPAPPSPTPPAATQPPPAPIAPIVSKPINNEPPEEPLALGQRRERSIANMQAIGQALVTYARK